MKRKVYVSEERTTFVEIWTADCAECGGDGRTSYLDEADYTMWTTCDSCNGTGEGDVETVNVAQREAPDHTWGPPTRVILEDS